MKRIAVIAGTPAIVAAIPKSAFAASFDSTVTQVTDTFSSAFTTVGYAILGLVAAVALLVIAKEILPALFSRERPEFTRRLLAAAVVVAVCIIAAFAPAAIDAVSTMAGTGVDLGSVSR